MNKSHGLSFTTLLTLIFIALKLTGVGIVAQWSWLWVLSPLWIPFILVFVIGFTLYLITKI